MQKQLSEGFFELVVIRNFAEFTRNHLCQNLFFIKSNSVVLQLHQKRAFSAAVANFAKFVGILFCRAPTDDFF